MQHSTEDDVDREARQLSRALMLLLRSVPRLADLWTEQGPTPVALALRDAKGGSLSSGERILLLAAFDLWDRSGGATVNDLLQLEPGRRQALCSLVIALGHGSDTVDSWLVVHGRGLSLLRP
jgi:hypothetical protein